MNITSQFSLAATLLMLFSSLSNFQADAMVSDSDEENEFSLTQSMFLVRPGGPGADSNSSSEEEESSDLSSSLSESALQPIEEDIMGELKAHYESLKGSEGADSPNLRIARWEWKLAKASEGKDNVERALEAFPPLHSMKTLLESYVERLEGRAKVKETQAQGEKAHKNKAQKLRGKATEARTSLDGGEVAMRKFLKEERLPRLEVRIQKLEKKIRTGKLFNA